MKIRSAILALATVSALTVSFSVSALDLQQAREQGILTEGADGYVSVAKPSPEANALASQVNTARKQEYERISKANGQPIDVVAKVAAGEIAKKMGK